MQPCSKVRNGFSSNSGSIDDDPPRGMLLRSQTGSTPSAKGAAEDSELVIPGSAAIRGSDAAAYTSSPQVEYERAHFTQADVLSKGSLSPDVWRDEVGSGHAAEFMMSPENSAAFMDQLGMKALLGVSVSPKLLNSSQEVSDVQASPDVPQEAHPEKLLGEDSSRLQSLQSEEQPPREEPSEVQVSWDTFQVGLDAAQHEACLLRKASIAADMHEAHLERQLGDEGLQLQGLQPEQSQLSEEPSQLQSSWGTFQVALKAARREVISLRKANIVRDEHEASPERLLKVEGPKLQSLQLERPRPFEEASEVRASQDTLQGMLEEAQCAIYLLMRANTVSSEPEPHSEQPWLLEDPHAQEDRQLAVDEHHVRCQDKTAEASEVSACGATGERHLRAAEGCPKTYRTARPRANELVGLLQEQLRTEQQARERLQQMNVDLGEEWRGVCEETSQMTASKSNIEVDLGEAKQRLGMLQAVCAGASLRKAALKKRLAEEGLEMKVLESECAQHLEEHRTAKDLHSQVETDLHAKCCSAREEASKARQAMRDLHLAKSDLQAKWRNASEEHTEGQQAVRDLHLAKSDLHAKWRNVSGEHAEELQTARALLESTSDLRSKLCGAMEEASEVQLALKDLQLVKSDLHEKWHNISGEHHEESQVVRALRQDKTRLCAEWRSASEEASEAQQALKDHQLTKSNLHAQLRSVHAAQLKATASKTMLESELKVAEGELCTLRKLSKDANACAASAEDQLRKDKHLLEKTRLETDKLRADWQEAEDRATAAEEFAAEYRAAGVRDLQRARVNASERAAWLEEQLQVEGRVLQVQRVESQILSSEASEALASEASQEQALPRVQRELRMLQLRLKEAMTAKDASGRNWHAAAAELQDLRDAKVAISERAASLEEQLEEEGRAMRRLREESGRLSMEASEIHGSRHALQRSLETMQHEVSSLRAAKTATGEREARQEKRLFEEGLRQESHEVERRRLSEEAAEARISKAALEEGLAKVQHEHRMLQAELEQARKSSTHMEHSLATEGQKLQEECRQLSREGGVCTGALQAALEAETQRSDRDEQEGATLHASLQETSTRATALEGALEKERQRSEHAASLRASLQEASMRADTLEATLQKELRRVESLQEASTRADAVEAAQLKELQCLEDAKLEGANVRASLQAEEACAKAGVAAQEALEEQLAMVEGKLGYVEVTEAKALERLEHLESHCLAERHSLEELRDERTELASELSARMNMLEDGLVTEQRHQQQLEHECNELRADICKKRQRATDAIACEAELQEDLAMTESRLCAVRLAGATASDQASLEEGQLAIQRLFTEQLQAEHVENSRDSAARLVSLQEVLAEERQCEEQLQREGAHLCMELFAADTRTSEVLALRKSAEKDRANVEHELRRVQEATLSMGTDLAHLKDKLAANGRQMERLQAECTDAAGEAVMHTSAKQEVLAAERCHRERWKQEAGELRTEAHKAAMWATEAAASKEALRENLSGAELELCEARSAVSEADHQAASAEGRLLVERRRMAGLQADHILRLDTLQQALLATEQHCKLLGEENHALHEDGQEARDGVALLADSLAGLETDLEALEEKLQMAQEAKTRASEEAALAGGRLAEEGLCLEHLAMRCAGERAEQEVMAETLEHLEAARPLHEDLLAKLAAAEEAQDVEVIARDLLQHMHEEMQDALSQVKQHADAQESELIEERASHFIVQEKYLWLLGQVQEAESTECNVEAVVQEENAELATMREVLLQERNRWKLLQSQLVGQDTDAKQQHAQEQLSAIEARVFAAQVELAAALDPCKEPLGPRRTKQRLELWPAGRQGQGTSSSDSDILVHPAVEPSLLLLEDRGGTGAGGAYHEEGEAHQPSQQWQLGFGSITAPPLVASTPAPGAQEAAPRPAEELAPLEAALGDLVGRALHAHAAGAEHKQARAKLEATLELCKEKWEAERCSLQRELDQMAQDCRGDHNSCYQDEWHNERCLLQGRIRQLTSELREAEKAKEAKETGRCEDSMLPCGEWQIKDPRSQERISHMWGEQEAHLQQMQRQHAEEQAREGEIAVHWREEWKAERRLLLDELELQNRRAADIKRDKMGLHLPGVSHT